MNLGHINVAATARRASSSGMRRTLGSGLAHAMVRRMRARWALGLLLLLLLLPGYAWGHQHAPMAMPAPNSHQSQLGAGAAFDANGRLWVVTARNGHVLLRHSDDFAKSFSAPVPVNATAQKIDAAHENHPDVAIGPQGQVYVTWVHPLPQKWASSVRFARSVDGGRHFSKAVSVSHDHQPITHSFDALAVDGHGRLIVAWIDSRGMKKAMAQDSSYRGLAIYYTWSDDAGKSFAGDHKLVDHSCECCRLALAHGPHGDVAAFFRMDYPGDVRDHAFAWLHAESKAGPVRRATFSGWKIAACPEQGPGLAVDGDGVRHAVWYEAAQGPAIWYGQLDPGHKTHYMLKIAGAGASHADVAVSGANVWLVWNQVSAKGYQLMLRASHDGGDHFDAPHAIAWSPAGVYSPQLLVHDEHAYVAWNTAQGFRLIAMDGARREASR